MSVPDSHFCPSPSGKPEDAILARIFFPREPDANPYYTSNQQLHNCSLLVLELLKAQVPVLRMQGGHRSGLKDDCQLTVSCHAPMLDELCSVFGCRWELV
ncbi:MAG: hypothetical protein VB100_09835 [Angelakisella sp.]|nr:hypothetical protein [Angelakisella sp.]